HPTPRMVRAVDGSVSGVGRQRRPSGDGQLHDDRRHPDARRPRARVRRLAGNQAMGARGRTPARTDRRVLRIGQGGVAEMKAAAWMTIVCVASVAAAVSFADEGDRPAIIAGMIGPLLAAGGTWVAVERTFRTNPSGLTGLMMSAFFVKMLA